MDKDLRDDEKFVIRALATSVSGHWWPGENPPDAYIKLGNQTVAVEISTLTQHVPNDEGRAIPRLSQDSTALRICEELNEELRSRIPEGRAVLLHLDAPIKQARKFKARLADIDTYRQAISTQAVFNPFDKVVIVFGDRTVVNLYEKHDNTP